MTSIHELGARELRDALRSGELSPTEVATHFLDRIERFDARSGAFVTVTPELALARAAELASAAGLASMRKGDTRLPTLWGVPLADKDLNDRAGVPTGHGSRLGSRLSSRLSGEVPATSDNLTRALDLAGAVSLGKTATPEFGLYGYTETADGPAPRHPDAPHLGTGGSSGGAAAAVAARMLPLAPGSDGGGSVRIPAAATGLVGIKPSRGLVPADAASPPTLTGVVSGPLAHTVADAALLLDGMLDPFAERLGASLHRDPQTLRIAATTASPWDARYPVAPEPGALLAYERTRVVLSQLGHDIRMPDALYPELDYAEIFTTAWQRSAASIPAHTRDDELLLEPVTRELMHRGRALTEEQRGQNDADLRSYGAELRRSFERFDVILTPALGRGPQPISSYSDDADENFSQQVLYSPYTSAINVAGLPAVVVPVGRYAVEHSSVPLSMGVQLVGRFGQEELLLRLARQLEDALQ